MFCICCGTALVDDCCPECGCERGDERCEAQDCCPECGGIDCPEGWHSEPGDTWDDPRPAGDD